MTRSTTCLAAALAALALAGCDPETNDLAVVVQPDGGASIRVVHTTAGSVVTSDERDPGRTPREAWRFMSGWQGVDAWSDVTATPIERGRTRVEATAWLGSLAELRTRGQRRFAVAREGAELEVRYLDPTRAGMSAIFLQDRRKVQAALAGPEAALEATIDDARRSVEALLGPWTFDLSIRLPGDLVACEGFTREADGRVTLHQDVLTLLALLEEHAAALRDARRRVAAGELTPEQGYAALARRDAEATAEATPRARCRLPALDAIRK